MRIQDYQQVKGSFLRPLAKRLGVPSANIVEQSILRFGKVVGAKYRVMVLPSMRQKAVALLGSSSTTDLLAASISKSGKFEAACWPSD